MKIAKIFLGDPNNQKGFFNNVIERTKHLMEVEPDVDCYMLRLEYGFILRLLKRQFKKPVREDFSVVNGIKFKNLWFTMGLLDYLLTYKLHKRLIVGKSQIKTYSQLFKDYDLLSCHGTASVFLSSEVKKKYCIPFVATWHGSEINVTAFQNTTINKKMSELLDFSDHNFFVSKALLDVSNKITKSSKKSVLYTGPSSSFRRFSKHKRLELKQYYDVRSTYVIGFIGNLIPIKNVLALPCIFKKVQENLKDVSFYVIGNGELEQPLLERLSKYGVKNFYMLGKQDPNNVPDLMNILDLLVLPSLNEGMPRVCLEAQACGVHVVGSNRGGIPEAVGSENCFELNEFFVERTAQRILTLLESDESKAKLPTKFSWVSAVKKEISVHERIIKDYLEAYA